MNDTPVTTYPDWQTTVRQAQAEMRHRAAEDQARRDQQEADRQRNLGADLAKALRHFGITVDTPEQNVVTVGDYSFNLDNAGYQVTGPNNYVRFSLNIWKAKPDHIDSEDWSGAHEWMTVHQTEMDSDWTPTLRAFADALDTVADRWQNHVHQWERNRQLYLAQQTTPTAEPTPDQQLADLIRRMVREELDGRYE